MQGRREHMRPPFSKAGGSIGNRGSKARGSTGDCGSKAGASTGT